MGPTEYEYRQALAWIDHLRTRVAQLETENAHLRLQFDELRRGVGVAVVIQGQTIPLAPLSRQPSAPTPSAMTGSQPVPPGRSQPAGSISAPFPPAFQPSAPFAEPIGAAPSGPFRTPYAENTWLTGPTPAVSPQRAPKQAQRPAGPPREGRPSQRMTPEWLRDEPPNRANNRPFPQQYDPTPRTTSQTPALGSPGAATSGGQPRPRGGVPARPLEGQQSGDRLPSLAELTGHVPAVRARAKQARRDHEAYDDSFVLG